jgi:tetratricopeptide (TPR) repeat protein
MRRSSIGGCALLLVLAVSQVCAVEREPAVQLNAKGMEMYRAGRYQEAEAFYRQALELPTPLRAAILVNLGESLRSLARYRQAEPLLVEAVQRLEAAGESESTNLAHALCSLAAVFRTEGKLDDAERVARRATGIGTEKDQSDARLCLAAVYIQQQRYADAETLVRDMDGRARGTSAAVLYNNMAAASNARRDFARGEELARRALAIAKELLPAREALIATILNSVAQSCRFQSKYVEAEENYRKAIEMWQQALGPSHPDVARGIMNMASFYHERSRDTAAEELYRRAAAIFAQSLGDYHLDTLVARNELGDVLRSEHRYVESERLSRTTLEPLKSLLAVGDARLGRALFHYASLLHETNRQKEADTVLQTLQASR